MRCPGAAGGAHPTTRLPLPLAPLLCSYVFAASSGAFVVGALSANALNPMAVCECPLPPGLLATCTSAGQAASSPPGPALHVQ